MQLKSFGTAVLCLCALAQHTTTAAEIKGGKSISVETQAVRFSRIDPEGAKFGELYWRGGISLQSSDPRFGGFSGLETSTDGKQIVAVSDKGWWLSASLSYKSDKLDGVTNARMAPLLTKKGKRSGKKSRHDAEALAAFDARKTDGPLIVGFERRERLEKFALDTGGFQALPQKIKSPKAMSSGPKNGELESVARIWQGPFAGWYVAVSERNFDQAGNIRGWRWLDSKTVEFAIKQHEGYRITDIALLPGAKELLTLERSFLPGSLPGMAIRRFEVKDLKNGAPAIGKVLLEVKQPFYAIDNMEGLAIHQTADGETRLTIISDDNYNRTVQSTLLLQFALKK